MLVKLVSCVFIAFSFLCVRSQRVWGSSNGGYNSKFPNSLNSNNGFLNGNNNNYAGIDNAQPLGSPFNFNRKPGESFFSSGSDKNSNWGYEASSSIDDTSGRNSNKPEKANSGNSRDWQMNPFDKRPDEKKLSSITNLPSSSKWNGNSNTSPFNGNNGDSPFSYRKPDNAKFSSSQSTSQNSRFADLDYNNFNNKKPVENEIFSEFDNEDNSVHSSWSSSNKKKNKPASNPFGGSGNWESATQKSKGNSQTSNWDMKTNNKKPQNPSESNTWNSNNKPQPGGEKTPPNPNKQNNKSSSAPDISILDELDKNDWYFKKDPNYPKPPFQSNLNIDVSELWNFDRNKKSNQRPSQSGNNFNSKYNNKRRNRETETSVGDIQCECVHVNFCEEEDMIVSQKDIKFDLRPLEEFRCESLTEVCCTNPKEKPTNNANLLERKDQLRCGQRRIKENLFQDFGDNIAEPGEFPWTLRFEGAAINCTASLIHESIALTAAHCVTSAQPYELTLRAGVWNSNKEPFQRQKVRKIIIHPGYNSRSPRNDIALLVLDTPFELTDNVNTICLPVTNDKWDSNQCVVAGWKSKGSSGQVLEILEKGTVNFIAEEECQNIILITDLWRNYVLHDSFVCGLEKTRRKSCLGDEGGFVVCPSKNWLGTYVQVGVISKGINCDSFGRPGIFTNVLKFLDWINQNYFELESFYDTDSESLE